MGVRKLNMQQNQENNISNLVKKITENREVYAEFLNANKIETFAMNQGLYLSEEEVKMITAMRDKILEVVNHKMMEMSDKISIVLGSAIMHPCNGTCW